MGRLDEARCDRHPVAGHYAPGRAERHGRDSLGCCASPFRCGRCRIEFAVALLDPPRADMALHRDTDVVWAIAGTCRVKFLPGFARRESENPLAQTRAFARRAYVPPMCFRLLLAAARGLAAQSQPLLRQRKPIWVSYRVASC
jgi:ferredoxin